MAVELEPRQRSQSRKPKNIRHHNKKLVLSLLFAHAQLSVSDIGRLTNLSKTTVIKIINDLLEHQLVTSVGKGESTEEGGKKPELFSYHAGRQQMIVINSGRMYLTDLHAKILDEIHILPDYNYRDYPDSVQVMAAGIRELMRSHQLAATDLAGIVISIAGIVDSEKGLVCHAVHSHTWPDHMPICQDLARILAEPVPIYLENDSSLFGYAELLDPENSQVNSIVTINSSSHTGGCVLLNHELIHGASGFVGEFGHVTVDYQSDVACVCGSRGCFEVMIDPEKLLQDAHEQYRDYPDSILNPLAEQDELTLTDVFNASNQHDLFACQLMDTIISWYAILIRNIIVHIDPQKIIIQGVYRNAGSYFIDQLHQAIHASPLFQARNTLLITYSKLDRQDFFRGVAYFMFQQSMRGAFTEN